MLRKDTVVKSDRVGTLNIFRLSVCGYLSLAAENFDLFFRVNADERISSPLLGIVNAFEDKAVVIFFSKSCEKPYGSCAVDQCFVKNRNSLVTSSFDGNNIFIDLSINKIKKRNNVLTFLYKGQGRCSSWCHPNLRIKKLLSASSSTIADNRYFRYFISSTPPTH